MERSKSLSKSITLWLLPKLIGVFGILCIFFTIGLAFETIIHDAFVFLLFLVATTIGFVVLKHSPILDNIYKEGKIKTFEIALLSVVTFGTITSCFFLFLNKVLAGENLNYRTEILKKELKPFGHRHNDGGYYKDYIISFKMMEHLEETTEFNEYSSTLVDTAEYISIKYKKGLFGYYVIIDYRLE